MININEEELQCKICYEFLYETVLCDKCSNAFCQECAINYKNKAKKYGRVDKCPICGSKNFTFQRCEEIDKLIKKRKQKPLQCQHCKRIIFDKEKYEQHIQQCKYQCKFCLMVFDKEDDLLRHIKKKTNELFKALDLMNASRNKVVFNEGKPKKKKLVKKRTKDVFNNDTKEEKVEKKVEKIEKETVEREEKEQKEEKEKKDEKEERDEKDEKEEKGIIIENNNFEVNSDLSKKIVKKKVIKKKKKIMKKKSRVNSKSNTINFLENNINEEDLLNHKINKTCIDDKLINEMKKLNISAEYNDKNTKMIYIKNRPLRISENSKDHIHNNFSSNTSKGKDNKININSISKSISNINNNTKKNINIHINNINNKELYKEESKKEPDKYNPTEKEENEKDEYDIMSSKKEHELIFSNSGKKNYNANNQTIEEEEKISRYVDYLNNPRPESVRPSTIPGEAKLNMEYDLYFCGKPNHIDCICCTEHKCKPGICMCISCMKLNKKYHKLKSHYLINKSGRACKYSHGSFHCYCNYTHIVHDVGNNIFKPIYKCQGENICKPCEEITLLMETYLPSTICQKLRDREARQAQF